MFRALLFLALILASQQAVCAADRLTPGSYEFGFKHNDQDRKYRLYVPKSYDPKNAVPLVFVFHGGGVRGNARTAERGLGFNPLAEKDGFLICYPEGVEHHWNDGRKSHRFPKKLQDDVGFISKLLNHLQATYKIDPDRVYAAGHSNGGFLTQRLGWELSDRFAAIASSAGTLAVSMESKFAPKHPVHVLHIHGTKDPVVPFEGGEVLGRGGQIVSAPRLIKLWVRANGCQPEPKIEILDKKTDDATQVRKESYAAGKKKAVVVLLALEGHGHSWGGRARKPAGKGITRELNSAEAVWEFFQANPKVRK